MHHGDQLTGNLLAWREEVLRQFRFDPKAAISSPEQRASAARFRTRQQQILVEAERQLVEVETLTAKCRVSLDVLTPELKDAVADWEQAEADLHVMTRAR